MSTKSRYHRTADERRGGRGGTGTGLGIAVGGAMAAALLSMGIASADVSDTEPDPFTDLLGANASATDLATAHAADMTLTTSNSDLATLLDNTYDVYSTPLPGDADPFEDLLPANATALQIAEALNGDISSSVSTLTTIDAAIDSGGVADLPMTDTDPDPFTDLLGPNATAAELGQAAGADAVLAAQDPTAAANDDQLFDASLIIPGDNDPFEDLLPANAPAAQVALAILLDNKLYLNDPTLNPFNIPTLTDTLDAQVDGALPPPVDTEPDPFLDALPATATAQQIADATAADTALATANPTLAGQVDTLVDAGNLPTGSPTDADAFSDLGLANGATLDTEFPALAQSLDPGVDQLLAPATDNDAFADLAQAFDPNAFNAAGAPADFIGQIAAGLDSLLAPGGIDAALDPVADNIISLFGITTAF